MPTDDYPMLTRREVAKMLYGLARDKSLSKDVRTEAACLIVNYGIHDLKNNGDDVVGMEVSDQAVRMLRRLREEGE